MSIGRGYILAVITVTAVIAVTLLARDVRSAMHGGLGLTASAVSPVSAVNVSTRSYNDPYSRRSCTHGGFGPTVSAVSAVTSRFVRPSRSYFAPRPVAAAALNQTV